MEENVVKFCWYNLLDILRFLYFDDMWVMLDIWDVINELGIDSCCYKNVSIVKWSGINFDVIIFVF